MAYAVALTYEGKDGPDQSVEVFESRENAEALRGSHAREFDSGSRQSLIALTLDELLITPATRDD